MCGRFTLTKPARRVAELFNLPEPPPELRPRYNIAPSQAVPVVGLKPDGVTRGLAHLKWGLVPSWANSPADGLRPINARAEGIEGKPTFREAFRHKRCLLVMDGYFEWRKKEPYYIHRPDGEPFGVAGLWDFWTDGTRRLTTCCMVTTGANEAVREIHDRMPVIVPPSGCAVWLDGSTPMNELRALLRPYDGELTAVRVGAAVGNVRNDGPELIQDAV